VAYPLINLGEVYRLRGDLDSAADYCKRGLALARESGASDAEIRGSVCLGKIARDRGDSDRAIALLERSLALARETDTARGTVRSHLALGELALERGDLDGSDTHLAEALDGAREEGFRYEEGRALVASGDLARALASEPRARERFADGVSIFREMGAVRDAVRGLERLALLCEESGDVTDALARYEAAAGLAHAAGFDDLSTSIEAQRARLAATL